MTDRELLEMAAKAAGLKHNGSSGDRGLHIGLGDPDYDSGWWNPLTDSGDAIRLSVTLCISIRHRTVYVDAFRGNVSASEYVPTYKDADKAALRAIVRCAAAIGKAMP